MTQRTHSEYYVPSRYRCSSLRYSVQLVHVQSQGPRWPTASPREEKVGDECTPRLGASAFAQL
jgi:hypothetical protein